MVKTRLESKLASTSTEPTRPSNEAAPAPLAHFGGSAPRLQSTRVEASSQPHSGTSSNRSSATVVARKLAAEAQHARHLAQLEQAAIELERKAANLELQAELAAIEAAGSKRGSRSGRSADSICQWLQDADKAAQPSTVESRSTIIQSNHIEDQVGPHNPRSLTCSQDLTGSNVALPIKPTSSQNNCHAEGATTTAGNNGDGNFVQLAQALQALVRNNDGPKRINNLVSLPIFDGKSPLEWLMFKRAFHDTAGSFTDVENLARLNQALKGAAREAVSMLLVMARHAVDVIDVLDRRFGRPEQIVLQEVNSVRALPKLGSEVRDLHIFTTRVRNCVEVANLLEHHDYLRSPELFNTLLGKLSPLLRTRWLDFAASHECRGQARVEMLSDFLSREVDLVMKFGLHAEASTSSSTHRDRTHTAFESKLNCSSTFAVNSENKSKKHCLHCKREHQLSQCSKFKLMSVDDRWRFVKENKICHRCLQKVPHNFRFCNKNKAACEIPNCQQKHHTLLHYPNYNKISVAQISEEIDSPPTTSDQSVEKSEQIASNTATSPVGLVHRPLLKVVAVTVSGPTGSVDTFALLDDGSTATFIDADVAQQIGAEGPEGRIHLDCIGGLSKDGSVQYVEFEIKGRSTSDSFTINQARSIKNLGLQSQSVCRDVISAYKYLSDLVEDLCYVEAKPTVLIGLDNWHLMAASVTRQGTKSQPAAIKTPLGWVLFSFTSSKTKPVQTLYNVCLRDYDSPRLELETLIKEQYKLDAIGITKHEPRSVDDQRALQILEQTAHRLSDGHFEVELLWKADDTQVPDSFPLAFSRFKSLEKKMSKDPVRGRILFQNLWRKGLDWDERLSEADQIAWQEWFETLKSTLQLRIPRCYNISETDIELELHVFCDASELAHVAVAYWRFILSNGDVKLALIASKARVSPLKAVSIPRLELQGALIAARLATTICSAHRFKPHQRFFWCDSMAVLGWLRSDARIYKPFVAHRIGEILENSLLNEWRWIPGDGNVADDASRGKCSSLDHSRWLEGPKFLLLPASDWPLEPQGASLSSGQEELKPCHRTLASSAPNTDLILLINTQQLSVPVVADINHFSSWIRLVRTTARIHHFIASICRNLHRSHTFQNFWIREICSNTKTACFSQASSVFATAPTPLVAEDLIQAERQIFGWSQLNAFKEELTSLSRGELISKKSRLATLSPVIDEDGLIHMSGRISSSTGVRPIILDGKKPIVCLLISHYHDKFAHANTETVINEMRQQYWILGIRNAVRSVVRKCQKCKLLKAPTLQPPMADLPDARLSHHQRPFTCTGLDYFGPLQVAVGRRREKRWVALFTCMVTRAVHLDVVNSLSSDAAVMCLRRFIARRGTPRYLYSDNGTSFVGANRQLRLLFDGTVADFAADNRISWRFIPPAAPFMGGAWERLVRSVKTALNVTMRERAPREDIFVTLLAEAEAVVNARPLTHVSPDADYPEALTPNHFLIGQSSGRPFLSGELTEADLLGRSSWRKALRLADIFWRRWVAEYLPTLAPRRVPGTNVAVKVGDPVLIGDGDLPRGTWPRGVIAALYPGRDGVVRVVDIQTQEGVLRRPLRKVVLL